MINNIGVILIAVSLVYSISLNFLYFSKEHVNNYETKIFSILVKINLIGLILELLCILSLGFIGSNNILTIIINKIFLISIATFMTLWGIYALYVTILDGKKKENKQKKYNIGKTTFLVIYLVSILFIGILPIKFHSDGGIFYSYGLSPNIVYTHSALCATICSLFILINWKSSSKRKIIPLLAYIVGGIILMVIQKINPALTLSTTMQTMFIFLMYNTMENPDVKMIDKLEMAKDQADKANRAKTDFLSSMSHEIRTPLNAIVGFSDYIMSADSLDEAKENAKDIVNASNTLLEIVNGILDISKIEAGKLEIVNSKYNARQTFEALAKLITPKMKEKGLDFTYYIAPDLPDTLFGDHANLKKIITNLLSNAYKYTEKGSVRYEVNCINNNNITKLIITVEDTGRGIKPDKIDSLFTKFQRLDEDKNTTIEGTGLGLAITKQLIELMGGKILVHTVYGEGSKFTVVLNQHIEKTEIVEEKVEIKTTLDLKNKKILLVDDNALNIKVANKILERFNANNITSLDNGFDCIDLIQSGAVFDIILMDDMMPKMSGVETFKKLREIEGFNQPVVILTANAITGMKEKYLKEGFEDYLAKPIEKDELIRVCNTIFQKYQSNQPEPPEETTKVEEINQEDKVENIKEVQLIEPIKPIEEIEELEIIGEDEPPVQTKETYLKENGVDLDKSLELLGDIEMYNMTLNDFLSEVEDKWNNIVTYKNNSDMENYAIEVHSLKSDAKYLGFMSLADISYQHELKSKENDINFILEHFNDLEAEYNKALAIAKTYNKM